MGRVTASDAELVEASRRGERAAFGELVERYQRVVCAVGYSGTSDRSLGEDVAQDTFVAAYHQLDQLRDVSRVREWLCGIARNLARKARRVRAREDVIEDDPADVAGSPFDATSERERDAVVAAALERVPETYREVLVLYYVEHRSVAAVASAIGISPDAVHQRLSRGRQLVAAEVAELVEHTLEHRRTRRNLAVAVLAALPVVTPSHANASPGGTSMLKIGIAASLVAALAGTGYAVHSYASGGTSHADGATTSAVAHPQGRPHATAAAASTSIGHAPISAARPPTLPAGVADHASYDCAAAARHLAALAPQMDTDQPMGGIAMGSGSGTARFSADLGAGTEQQCLAEHWPQSLIDCLATADDLWNTTVKCAADAPVDGPTPAEVAQVSDASCVAVGTHVASLVVPRATDYDPNDVPSVVIDRMNDRLAGLPDQIEAACAGGDWSESLRRCVVAASSIDAIRGCK